MKIAIISDTHLGFAPEKRPSEAFEQAKSAFELALQENVDFVLMPGDIFHRHVPKQETFIEAFKLFSLFRNAEKSDLKIFREKKDRTERKEVAFNGIPVVVIHGTHEYRSKDFLNAIQVLDAADFAVYMHAQQVIIEKGTERVVIHGFGGVPEKKAVEALRYYDPKPYPDAKNILMLHQSFAEFLPFDDEMVATLSIADLPQDFDLLLNGHLHWNSETTEAGKKFVVPGSTVITQMKMLESKKPKGILLFDSVSGKTEFKPLPKQRSLYYKKFDFVNAGKETVLSECRKQINEFLDQHKEGKIPLIRLRLKGSLAKGVSSADLGLDSLLHEFEGKAVFSRTLRAGEAKRPARSRSPYE